jgi:hypothetical protein
MAKTIAAPTMRNRAGSSMQLLPWVRDEMRDDLSVHPNHRNAAFEVKVRVREFPRLLNRRPIALQPAFEPFFSSIGLSMCLPRPASELDSWAHGRPRDIAAAALQCAVAPPTIGRRK